MSRRSTTCSDRDARDLAGFGYRQKLDRSLGGFSAFAAGFSYLSVLTGSSQLFHIGYDAGGPAFFWTWPAVFLGQMFVALCFAEMASRYPLSGGVYQWSKQLGEETLGWMAGWVYLACSIITLASTALALQAALPQISPWFQFFGSAADHDDSARNAVALGCGLIMFTTLVNAFGVRLLARINNIGVFVEMFGVILLIGLLWWVARRPPQIVFDAQGRAGGSIFGFLGPAMAASLMASFVLYGFDTAGSLAEETDDPRRKAPRAILLSLAAVGTAGSLLVYVAVRAVSRLDAPELTQGAGALAFVVKDALGESLGTPFLLVMACSIVVCTLTVHAAAVRVIFAMARDNFLPFAGALAKVDDATRTPTLPAIVIGVAAAGLLALNVDHPQVIEVMASVAVVWANLAYLFVTVPLLLQRRLVILDKGRGYFSLHHLGPLVNILAVLWGVVIVVNIGWPRAAVYGTGWMGRFGAAPPTIAMLIAGWGYDRLVRRHRGGVLAEHQA